jgi:hypothetical protein
MLRDIGLARPLAYGAITLEEMYLDQLAFTIATARADLTADLRFL